MFYWGFYSLLADEFLRTMLLKEELKSGLESVTEEAPWRELISEALESLIKYYFVRMTFLLYF